MAKMKAYVGHTMLAPPEWAKAVGITTHHNQIDVLAYATSKAALVEHLMTLGEREHAARNMAGGLTLPSARSHVHYGIYSEAFMDEVPPGPDTGPAVYISHGNRDNAPVLRVDDDGAYTEMGHYRSQPGTYRPRFEPTRH